MDTMIRCGVNTPQVAPVATTSAATLEVLWAQHQDEVQAAQRLRHDIFALEMGAQLRPPAGTPAGLDVDEFDDYCEHLLVRTAATDDAPARVVGTYRVMLPQAAARAGRYYSESEFDLSALEHLRGTMAELGRSCIHPQWRDGGVILTLWSHLIRFLVNNGAQRAIGCASVPMRDGGLHAARIWNELRTTHLSSEDCRVQAYSPLPVDRLHSEGAVDLPPLIRGYLKCGAQVMGAPAWDPDFGTADLPMLLDFDRLPNAYRRRFLAA